MIPRILIVSDNSDARSKGLAHGLRRRGAVAVTAPLASIAFDTGQPSGLAIPGFGERLPDAVLVRSIAAGSGRSSQSNSAARFTPSECRSNTTSARSAR